MTALAIRRIGAEITHPDRTDPGRVQRLVRRLADHSLDDRRAGCHGLSGEWCVRRIDVELLLGGDDTDATAAERWADLIATSVRGLVPDGQTVLHYPDRGRALTELAESVVAGSHDRAWAWRQLGLLTDGEPEPVSDPAGALLAALGREPEYTVGVVVHLVRGGSLTALDRLLGEHGWVALASLVDPATTAALTAERPPPVAPQRDAAAESPVRLETTQAAVLTDSTLLRAGMTGSLRPTRRTLAAWAVLGTADVEPHRPGLAVGVAAELVRRLAAEPDRRPGIGDRHRDRQLSGRVGPGDRTTGPGGGAAEPGDHVGWPPPTDTTNTTDTADTTSPGGHSAAPAAADGEQSGRPIPGDGSAPPQPAARPPSGFGDPDSRPPDPGQEQRDRERQSATGQTAGPRGPAGLGRAADDVRAGRSAISAQPERDELAGAGTAWAGLLFLLNCAAAAGVPEELEEDSRLAGRTVRWILHQLAQRLVPVRADDPAALALAGLLPDAAAPTGSEAGQPEEEALGEHAARWAAVTLAALHDAAQSGDDPPATLWLLARRAGRVVADPGWFEVQLDLAGVDVAVRRAGLDIDPGWVSWLGTVVRFRYV